jgi:hypothetical protein
MRLKEAIRPISFYYHDISFHIQNINNELNQCCSDCIWKGCSDIFLLTTSPRFSTIADNFELYQQLKKVSIRKGRKL